MIFCASKNCQHLSYKLINIEKNVDIIKAKKRSLHIFHISSLTSNITYISKTQISMSEILCKTGNIIYIAGQNIQVQYIKRFKSFPYIELNNERYVTV